MLLDPEIAPDLSDLADAMSYMNIYKPMQPGLALPSRINSEEGAPTEKDKFTPDPVVRGAPRLAVGCRGGNP